MTQFVLNNQWVSLEELERVLKNSTEVVLGPQATLAIERGFSFLQGKVKEEGAIYYGINTGFGSLCNTAISNNDLEQLQRNLVLSHACGMGDEVPSEIVKIMMALKIKLRN